MGKHFVVAGAGFRGFCDALHLLKTPGNTVHIVDSAPFFGGVMHSLVIDGFFVDKGVHVFDSIPVELAEVIDEIMGGQTREIDFVSASAFNGKTTDGFSLPDLASLDDDATKDLIRDELNTLAMAPPDQATATTLRDLFTRRYGTTAGGIFSDVFERIYSITADEVEATAIAQTSMGRLKFLDDDGMLEMKKDPFLETVLAARRKSMGKVDDFVSIYPDTGEAMKGWCDRAVPWLEARGASISLGEQIMNVEEADKKVRIITDKQTIEADHLIWANDNVAALASALEMENTVDGRQHATPLVFHTFMTQASEIRDFTYLQNFDPNEHTYRTAAAGLFSNQVRDDGVSFITCECPAAIGSERWENADTLANDVWEECRALGVVSNSATVVGHDVKRIPATFKLAKLGYQSQVDDFCARLSEHNERVVLRNVIPFFRRDIYFDSAHLRELVS